MTIPASPGDRDARRQWKAVLSGGPDCVPIERLAEAELGTEERAHLDGCARCQAERTLLMEFEAAEPGADEGAVAEWIARETKRRLFPEAEPAAPSRASGGWFRLPAWAVSVAAVVLLASGAYLVLRSPATRVESGEPGNVYRAVGVELTSPLGDLDQAPDVLQWRPMQNAASYDVQVLEVDGTEVWRTMSPTTSVVVPEVVRVAARPARTLTWSVAALDANGSRLGQPGTGSFRVRPPPGQ